MAPAPGTPAAGGPHREVLWSATLGQAGLDERIDAAANNGYRGLTIHLEDIEALRAEGRDPRDVARRARDLGVEVLILEALSSWYEHEPAPSWFSSDFFTLEDHLAAAELLGSVHANVVAPFRSSETVASLTERFAIVCDRFAELGVAVHLEFTPFSPIASLATAWEIVRGGDRPNAGILLDTWHFFQGMPDLDLLASIPGERILSVQLNDGRADFVESLVKDTFRHRLLPGEGTFDLPGVLRVLQGTGGLNLAGPEVLSTELDALAPDEAARMAGAAFDRVVSAI